MEMAIPPMTDEASEEDTNLICSKCREFTSRGEEFLFPSTSPEPRYRHHDSYLALSLSARAGCSLCRLMSETLLEDAISRATVVDLFTGQEPITIDSMSTENIGIDNPYVYVNARQARNATIAETTRIALGELHFYTSKDNPAAQDPRVVGRDVSKHSGSPECLSLLTGWLDECCASHENCAAVDPLRLPPRVIDLGPLDAPLSPYLLISEGGYGLYATLSHCWGPKEFPPLMTTTGNFSQHKEKIPLPDVSASFLDAMTLTRSLGLRYLWIDSICIIQDSSADWAAQSVLMASIYGQSHINISAAAAGNSHEGIFRSRSVPHQMCPIPYQSKYMASKGEIFVRAPLKTYVPGDEFNHTFNAGKTIFTDPLLTRAWVLQERMLSPRNIHFGAGELLWECQTLTAYESRTKSISEGSDADLKRMLAPKESNKETSNGWVTRDIYARWIEIVGAYSRLDLTYETDKFPAISGLAREFQRQTGDEYLAGLWKSDLHRSLLWRPAGVDNLSIPSKLLRRQPHDWRAPSWSWASWDGYIDGSLANWHHRVNYEHDIAILHAKIEPSDKDVFGRLKGGYIRVRGLWNRVRLGEKGLAAFKVTLEGSAANLPAQYALLDQPDKTNRGSRYAPVSDLTGSVFDVVQISIWNDHQPSNEFYSKSDDTWWSLLLEPSKDGINCYCRVGVAYFRLEQEADKLKMCDGWEIRELTII